MFDISDTTKSVKPFTNFVKRKAVNKKLNATDPQYGLCLKTYNSDIYQNWINTEWIEGVTGINEASAQYRDWETIHGRIESSTESI